MAIMRTISKGWLPAAIAVAASLPSPSASAGGFYNVPSRLMQCLGYGPGAGYHAPLVLGPAYTAGTASQRVVRLDAHPAPASHWATWHGGPGHRPLPHAQPPQAPPCEPPLATHPPVDYLPQLPPPPTAAPATPLPPVEQGEEDSGKQRQDLPSPSDRVLGLRRLPAPLR